MKQTSFLALLGKKFPEKLSGLSVKGGGGYPLFPLRVFWQNDFPFLSLEADLDQSEASLVHSVRWSRSQDG